MRVIFPLYFSNVSLSLRGQASGLDQYMQEHSAHIGKVRKARGLRPLKHFSVPLARLGHTRSGPSEGKIESRCIIFLDVESTCRTEGWYLPLKTGLSIKYPFTLCLRMVNGVCLAYQRRKTLKTAFEI